MRKEVERLFGQKMQFMESDVVGRICGGSRYDADADEFVDVGDGCGFASPVWLVGAIARTGRSDDKIYIYERVLYVDDDGGDEITLYHVSDDNTVEVGEYIGMIDDVPWEGDYDVHQKKLNAVLAEYALQSGDEFKWTFGKTSSGNYVFEKIERL